jgi:uncharacterized protein (DUF362 family)/ferredoxin
MYIETNAGNDAARDTGVAAAITNTAAAVALVQCADYDAAKVAAAAEEMFTLLGGVESFAASGDKILLKVNLVAKATPDRAVTTHPALVEAVARLLIARGAAVTICDSPGGLFNEGFVRPIYKAAQMTEAAQNSGASLNELYTSTLVKNDIDCVRRGYNLELIDAVLNADKIINMAKLKTHGFTGFTGAVKNLYGTIAGLAKVQMHSDNQNVYDFCDFLIDLEQYLAPKVALHIIDAVVAMERDGPTAGDPKPMRRLIASKNPYNADYVGVKMMNADPFKMPQLAKAAERGLLSIGDFAVSGCDLEESVVKDFKYVVPEGADLFKAALRRVPKFLINFLYKNITRKPKIKKSKCRACGKCKEHCPKKAIVIKKKAAIDYHLCIKCFCCQELCPFKAIAVKKPLLYRFATRSSRR